MKRVALLILMTLLLTQPISTEGVEVSSEDAPDIVLPFEEGAEILLAVPMGGSANITHSPEVRVNDSDGVSTVFFRFNPVGNDTWFNVTATRVEGNSTEGTYTASFEWTHTSVDFKVFANDTLGEWSETGSIRYLIDYVGVSPQLYLLIIIPIILIVIAMYLKKRN